MANTASASNVVSAQPVPSAHSPRAWSLVTLGKLGITRARPSTKIVIGLGMASSVVLSALWLTSGKTYLDLGLNWIGLGAFGVGFFQGKIFYSSAITFILTFVISYFILVERQSRNPIVSIAVSALVVLSAAYTFEFVYLYLNNQALLKYLTRFNWWFNLLAGLIIGFGFRFMRINKVSIALFSLFAASFAVWYFAGYPQLADKEIPVQLFTNYIGLPVDWAYPLNAIAKLLGCLATASLLIGGGMRLHSGAPTLELASIAQPTREIGILRNLGSIFNRPLGACAHCGRKLRYKDRYCDSCGKPIGSSNEIPASTLF